MSGSIENRLSGLPQALRARTVFTRLGDGVPALLAHPDEGWNRADGPPPRARPTVVWMHGRTVNKELDPGRYLRWLRAGEGSGLPGIATCAIDLPGHGERFDPSMQGPDRSLEVVEQAASEIDGVVAALGEARFRGAFDLSRLAIGGMSAGGMATLIRLCRPHTFRCAAVESTAGDFEAMASSRAFYTRGGSDASGETARRLDPSAHLDSWRPIPLLALHSEADEWVPVGAMRSFIEKLRERYASAGADPELAKLVTWPTTGAPNEHAGFGRVSNDAKNLQTGFLWGALV